MNIEIKYDGAKLLLPEIACDCGGTHAQPDMDIYIGKGVIENCAEYIQARVLGKNVVVVTDNIVYDIAGKRVEQLLRTNGYQVTLCKLEREEPLIPNEVGLGEILLTLDDTTDFLVAVGSGSITDLTRYVSYRTGKPFVCVGTAPSMDGYTSVIAPLTLGNLKVNKPADYPRVLICDLAIMAEAPYDMLMAGFGDVVGKYIAKADWTLGHIVNNEPICPACIDIVTQAVEKCIDNIEGIKNRTEAGIQSLIEGLILAGLTILIIGHTRPVASNEHGMAHYWEMMKLLRGEEPASHGISVGVATVYAIRFFEEFLDQPVNTLSLEKVQATRMLKEERDTIILEKYSPRIGEAILRDNPDEYLAWDEQKRRFQIIVDQFEAIRKELDFLPNTSEIIEMYQRVGAPYTAADIGIDTQLLEDALVYAKDYRNRYTVFKSANELGILGDVVNRVLTSR